MEKQPNDILKASERQIEKVAIKLFQAADSGRDVMAGMLRMKFVKLVQRHGELLEKFQTNGKNVKQQIVLESYGFNIEFFVENAERSEKLAEGDYKKICGLKIFDKAHKEADERTK